MRKNPSMFVWGLLGAGAVAIGIGYLVWRGRAVAEALPQEPSAPPPVIGEHGEVVRAGVRVPVPTTIPQRIQSIRAGRYAARNQQKSVGSYVRVRT